MLISVEKLHQKIINSSNIIILDCCFDLKDPNKGEESYRVGHIPNAIYVHLDRDLSGIKTESTGRHPLPSILEIEKTFSRLGIDASKEIITYDDQDMMYAARCWWLLKYCGHKNVSVLNGGFEKWKSAGYEIKSGVTNPIPSTFKAKVNSSVLIQVDEVLKAKTLVDSRDSARYRGEIEPIDKKAGHIPGAENYFYKLNMNSDGTLKDSDTIKKGMSFLEKDPKTVFYCGSGVSACVNILAAHCAGYDDVKLYAGSWSEWISDANRPVSKTDQYKP